MDKYYEIKDKKLLEKYPDIKIVKALDSRTVAFYIAVSESPENDASKVLLKWAQKHKLIGKSRVFGFNNPNPVQGSKTYGYELQIEVKEDFVSDDENIKIKHVEGGLYAVKSTKVSQIENDWHTFVNWLELSEYEIGPHQWMEEHITFEGDIKIDLYLPIK